jgi:outer membrane protein/adhesin transport system outer membrane protein
MKMRATAPIGGLILLAAGMATDVSAQTLREALALAYQTNPTLDAQRAQLRATDEGVPQAKAGWRPTVSVTGSVGKEDSNRNLTRDQNLTPRSIGANITQPLYRGGRTQAQIAAAEAIVQAQRARLHSIEQTVLLQSVTAYLDVVRDEAIVDLTRNNEQVLRRQLEAANDRFRVGEITKTDVAQAESRLARATSDRVSAEGNLISSRATFNRVVGQMPATLEATPGIPDLPANEDEALRLADAGHPDIQTAIFVEQAARHDIDTAFGALLPTLSLEANLNKSKEVQTEDLDITTKNVLARLTIPLYQAGSEYSLVRQRKETAGQRRIEVDDQRRIVRQAVTRAWEGYNTARSRIVANEEQTRASRIALDGVQQEATVGSRTVLDVLDAEQELLNANVQLVTARRDRSVAAYQLLSSTGQLTAERLGLQVDIYDPTTHYNKVRNQWIGLSPGND